MGLCVVPGTDPLYPPCTSEHCHFEFVISLRACAQIRSTIKTGHVKILDVQYVFAFRRYLFSQGRLSQAIIGICISMQTSSQRSAP